MIRYYTESVYVAYAGTGKLPLFTANQSKQIGVLGWRAMNNSGSSGNIGLCRLFNLNAGSSTTANTTNFHLWQYTASGPTVTEVSNSIVAGTATAIFDTTNNDGYILQTKRRAGLIGMTISTGHSGGTYTYKYWNGTSFTTLTTLAVPSYTSTGDVYTVFLPPVDWVPGATASIGLDQTKYSILVQGTTAPGGNVSITNLWVAEFIDMYQSVSSGSGIQDTFSMREPLLLEGGEGLMPYFSSTSSANTAGAFFVSI